MLEFGRKILDTVKAKLPHKKTTKVVEQPDDFLVPLQLQRVYPPRHSRYGGMLDQIRDEYSTARFYQPEGSQRVTLGSRDRDQYSSKTPRK